MFQNSQKILLHESSKRLKYYSVILVISRFPNYSYLITFTQPPFPFLHDTALLLN
jgi:hypothetical protein